MPIDGPRLLAAYKRMDAALVRAGWHATSLPWMAALERFWLSGKTRMVVRKGRQSGFSSLMERVDVCTGLYGEHRFTRGRHLSLPNVSIKMSEASERLYGIAQILDVLGVATRPSGDSIEVIDDEHPPIVFLTMACNFRTAVGLTAVAVVQDEIARWMNEDGSANPAREVDASITPMGVTQPNFRIYSGSSPLATEDFHAELFARGETPDQCVFEGPSWYWSPVISEADTRRLQPDERIWSREFKGIPSAARCSAFDADASARAFAHPRPHGLRASRHVQIDASSGKKDRFTFGVCGWVMPESPGAFAPYLSFDLIDGVDAGFWAQENAGLIADRIKALATEWDCREVHGDQREELMLRAAFQQRDLRFLTHAWTAQSKPLAIERVRRWFAEGTIALPDHDGLRRELLAFEERITPSGAFTFGARGSGHDDYVSLLITAALAELDGDLVAHDPGPGPKYSTVPGAGTRYAIPPGGRSMW